MENFFLKGQPAPADNMAEKTDIQTLSGFFCAKNVSRN
jgi:hypothetical protein